MRISDWSSDVCSSDLSIIPSRFFPYWKRRFLREEARLRARWRNWHGEGFESELDTVLRHVAETGRVLARDLGNDDAANPKTNGGWWDWHPSKTALEYRSEEHTSELQSLMRISYAVFCLKKKSHTRPHEIELMIQTQTERTRTSMNYSNIHEARI